MNEVEEQYVMGMREAFTLVRDAIDNGANLEDVRSTANLSVKMIDLGLLAAQGLREDAVEE